jgi:hypothetical protein
MRFLVLATCALCICTLGAVAPATSHAGANASARASLSWSQAGTASVDIDRPSAVQSLYVRFTGLRQFKGAEIDVVWSPADKGAGCAAIAGSLFRTSGDCSFINRGTSLPIVVTDLAGRYRVAWANTTTNTDCADGVGVVLQFQFDACAAFTGCYALVHAFVLDDANEVDECAVPNGALTIGGGAGGNCGGQSKTTWGNIKSIFSR